MRLPTHTQVNTFNRARTLPAQATQARRLQAPPSTQAPKHAVARMLDRVRAWFASWFASKPDISLGKPIMARRVRPEDPYTKMRRKQAERSRRRNRVYG